MDGGVFVSEHIPPRKILLNLFVAGGFEDGRRFVCSIFKANSGGELYFNGSLKIACRVLKVSFALSGSEHKIQVILICPDPYFTSITRKRVSMQGIMGLWEFPWEIPKNDFEFAMLSTDRIAKITNNGEVETGCIFELTARAFVKNPRLQNINTFEWIQLNVEMQAEDAIIINTIKGQKSISLTRNGVKTNIINYKVWGSTFLQLSCGLNEIVCDADEGLNSLSIMCFMSERYGGV